MQRLFQEDEENGEDETDEGDEMVPLERLSLEYEEDEEAEDGQRDHFLDNLELRQYSKKAIPQEKRMTRISGQPVEIFISWSLRWPYQANVMNTFENRSMMIVQIPRIVFGFSAQI